MIEKNENEKSTRRMYYKAKLRPPCCDRLFAKTRSLNCNCHVTL